MTLALYADVSSGVFVIFDSHQMNEHGVLGEDGAAVFLTFDSFDELLAHICTLYHSSSYELTPVLSNISPSGPDSFSRSGSNVDHIDANMQHIASVTEKVSDPDSPPQFDYLASDNHFFRTISAPEFYSVDVDQESGLTGIEQGSS